MALKANKSDCNFESEPLVRPFGFKGAYMNNIWQVAVRLETGGGTRSCGLGTQNVLWCDPRVFTSTSRPGGNALMFTITDRASKMACGVDFSTPLELMDRIFDDLYDYAKHVTGLPDLRKTFLLNALVPLDNAAWLLYARLNGLDHFDHLVPAEYREPLSHRHERIASIPISSYAMPVEEVVRLVKDQGYFILKFKLGSPGSQSEMLENDMARLEQIHRAVGDVENSHTENGKPLYYFDPNGRYENKDTLKKLLHHARKIGAFEQILLVEEPFPEEYQVDVGDLGVLVAADESAHTAANVNERIEMNYGAIALKPAAKTLSMTLKMARQAYKSGTPCFCADLTVNPILVDWNKTVSARLAPLPGLDFGLLETNGHQNYKNWQQMKTYHTAAGASWIEPRRGVFELDEDFYTRSAGILNDSTHYNSLLE